MRKVTGYYSGTLIEGTMEFLYGAEHQRVRQIRVKDGATTTTDYVHPDNQGGLAFEKVTVGATVTYKHYISGGSGTTAVVITGAENRTEYWHKDHLGSVAVMTNESGVEITGSRRYFDAWGHSPTQPTASGKRGYTGHEHLDFGIVHMNGRTYDPILGRMMGADPFIQDPGNLQSYNRFTYCVNNPVACTDPSGYFFGSFVTSFVQAVVSYYCVPCGIALSFAQAYRTNDPFPAFLNAIATVAGLNIPGGGGLENTIAIVGMRAAAGCVGGMSGGGGCGRGALAGAINGLASGLAPLGSFEGALGTLIAGCAAGALSGQGCSRGAGAALGSWAGYSAAAYIGASARNAVASAREVVFGRSTNVQSLPGNIISIRGGTFDSFYDARIIADSNLYIATQSNISDGEDAVGVLLVDKKFVVSPTWRSPNPNMVNTGQFLQFLADQGFDTTKLIHMSHSHGWIATGDAPYTEIPSGDDTEAAKYFRAHPYFIMGGVGSSVVTPSGRIWTHVGGEQWRLESYSVGPRE